MGSLGDGVKKVLLAGIGTVAVTAEKSKEVLDKMAERGEAAVEQGKVLNQELRHNIKKTVKENVNVSVRTSSPEELDELLDKMTPEQIEQLKERIYEREATVSEEETKTNSAPNNVTSNETKKNPVKATKSEIANLKSLGITPNDFKGFKPTTFSYNINVPNDVETVNVYATPQDRRARVTGLGNQKLNLGKNTIKITVTAESGAKKEYTLNITRQEEKEEEKVNKNTSSEVPNSKDLIELGLKGYEITPKFSPDVYSYKAFINADISEVEVVAKEASDKVEVEVVGNKDLINGENLITIFVYNKDTKQNSTYQIDLSKTNINFEENNATLTNATKKANFIINIILGVIIFILIMLLQRAWEKQD